MIGKESKGFFAAHWDWLIAGLGALALAGGAVWMVVESGADPDEAARDEAASLGSSGGSGAKKIDDVEILPYAAALKLLESPTKVVEPAEKQGSFLASARRVFCEQGDASAEKPACGQPIPFGLKTCPLCGAKQPEEAKVSLDSDGDGIPDEVEVALGMNPNDPTDIDGDLDGDGFTNAEEFAAKTDPKDPASHPDYLDSLRVDPNLKAERLAFYFEAVMQTPGGAKFSFRDPKARNDNGGVGRTYRVLAGEEIGTSGFVVKSYEQKSQRESIKGTSVKRERDTSTVELERKSDGKRVTLTIGEKRFADVDIQVRLVYERGAGKEFTVVKGDTIELNGESYLVKSIARDGKSVKVTFENAKTGTKTVEALEQ
ncbi:MAG: hypothetical protein J6U17_04695 [Kiritimatiellae bacterium]|nr:hypothetical protein [Kiritimatiellia bacterium]